MKVYIICTGDYCACERDAVIIKKVLLDKKEVKKELEKLSKKVTYVILQIWENNKKNEQKFIKFKYL